MGSLFTYDSSSRPSLEDIKKHPWFTGKTLTKEQLEKEFSKRRQRVDAELEKQRVSKLMEKEKQK